ncbi:MAG: tRNA epoxyqueuosine(34) reductase QueG [Pseudomonadota bacterium]
MSSAPPPSNAAETNADSAADTRCAAVKRLALSAGFDAARITSPSAIPDAPARLSEFLKLGRHGDMSWMADRTAQRADPSTLWSEVRSIIMIGQNYGPDDNPLELLQHKEKAAISVYAKGKDYHDVVKKRLKRLARAVIDDFGGEVKVFVDTAPVMEKPLAEAAGLGWQGKHTNLVSRDFGSWLFLGSIYTTLDLTPDTPEADHCGACTACLDICPTNAFPEPYKLDARRCISYLTIEHKGHIPREFRTSIGNRIYGCDDCLAVCPWNKFAQRAEETKLHARDALKAPTLADLADLDDANFRTLFAGTPVKRTGRDRFIRNVMIALGNSGDKSLAASTQARLIDPSPLVRAAAVWAMRRLLSEREIAPFRDTHARHEPDPDVKAEWTASLQ